VYFFFIFLHDVVVLGRVFQKKNKRRVGATQKRNGMSGRRQFKYDRGNVI
jgi:hypothetical protein